MLRIFYVIMLLMCCRSTMLLAQAPPVQWQKVVSFGPYSSLSTVIECTDGNFIGMGQGNTKNPYIFKLGPDGSMLWQKPFNAGPEPTPYKLLQTSSGKIMAAGRIRIPATSTKETHAVGHLLQFDTEGNVLWEKKYDGSGEYYDDIEEVMLLGTSYINSITATRDGGFLLGLFANGNAGGDKTENRFDAYSHIGWGGDYWLVKIDSFGVKQWDKTVGSGATEFLTTAYETADSGYVVGGTVVREGVGVEQPSGYRTGVLKGVQNFWIVKLDKNRTMAWDKVIGGSGVDRLSFLQPTTDSAFIIAGTSSSPISGDKTEGYRGGAPWDEPGDYWALKLDSLGRIVWQKTIGGKATDILVAGFLEKDGGCILAGYSASGVSGEKTQPHRGEELVIDPDFSILIGAEDYWFVKVSAAGQVVWDKTMGGDGSEYLLSLSPTKNGAFIAGGTSWSQVVGDKSVPNEGYNDNWLIKFGPLQKQDQFCPSTLYTFNGNDLDMPGVYSATYQHVYDGSDSVVELTLQHFETQNPDIQVQQNLFTSTAAYGNYQWLFNGAVIPGATSRSFVPKQEGIYKLVVTDPNGCKDTSNAYHPLFKSNLFVPNMFSPNGDGKNDIFKVFGNNLTYVHLQIYNQWGQKVFETTEGLNNGWDGRINGKVQPIGVYIYTVQAGEINGEVFKQKGTVTIVQ